MAKLFPNSVRRATAQIGHLFREGIVNIDRHLQPKNEHGIVFCVDDANNGMSSGLRGYKLAKELRTMGWRTIVIPKQLDLRQRLRIIEQERPTYIYLQQTRHPLNRPDLYPSYRCILDIDDADFLDEQHVDYIKSCMVQSFGIIAGSRFIGNYARVSNGRCEVIWTGAPVTRHTRVTHKLSPPAVVWACSNPEGYLHEANFVRDVVEMIDSSIDFQFWIIGTRDIFAAKRYLAPLKALGISCASISFLPYLKLLVQLRKAAIGLAPLLPQDSPFSAGKSFGKVLAYLDSGLAVIASNNVDHPLFFKNGVNGYLASDKREWVLAIERLLRDSKARKVIADAGKVDFSRRLSTRSMALRVDKTLRKWLAATA